MLRKQVKSVSIVSSSVQPALSKGQQTFNSLIRKIEKQRALLLAWEHAIPPYQRKYTEELLPRAGMLTDYQEKMVFCLDDAWSRKELTKSERKRLSKLIAGMARDLAANRDENEALKAVYNRHSGSDYEQEEAGALEGMQSFLEDALGLDLGDGLDEMSPGEFFQNAREKLAQMRAEDEAQRQAQQDRRAKRKKSAKQQAREAQQEAEAQQASKSIREVFRRLASALHPDRETDVAEQQRKTLLMQRVNEAYAKSDLLALLELQLELEHIDQSSINTISEERLKHFNKVLKEQSAELQQEIWRVEGDFRGQFGIDLFAEVSPRTIGRDLDVEIAELQRVIRDIERDLERFDDIRNIKAWLKEVKRASAMDDIPF